MYNNVMVDRIIDERHVVCGGCRKSFWLCHDTAYNWYKWGRHRELCAHGVSPPPQSPVLLHDELLRRTGRPEVDALFPRKKGGRTTSTRGRISSRVLASRVRTTRQMYYRHELARSYDPDQGLLRALRLPADGYSSSQRQAHLNPLFPLTRGGFAPGPPARVLGLWILVSKLRKKLSAQRTTPPMA